MHIGVRLGPRGWPFAELVASWRAAEEAGFAMVSCSDQLTAHEGGPSWDAPSMLTVMGACTSTVPLAIHVVNIALRDPVTLAAQIAAAQALSGGRVSVGLGAGMPQDPVAREPLAPTKLSFRDRVARLDAFCRVLPALWRGHAVSHSQLGLRDARLGPTGIVPPQLVVGGSSDPVLTVAARHADVWNGVGTDPDAFAANTQRLASLRADTDREHDVTIEALVPVDHYVADRQWDDLREHLARLEGAGAARVVLSLELQRGPDAVNRLAEALGIAPQGADDPDLAEQPR